MLSGGEGGYEHVRKQNEHLSFQRYICIYLSVVTLTISLCFLKDYEHRVNVVMRNRLSQRTGSHYHLSTSWRQHSRRLSDKDILVFMARLELQLAEISWKHCMTALTFKLLHDSAQRYLGPLVAVADLPGRRALRSASTSRLVAPPIKLSTVGSRAFPVAAAQV